MLHLVVVGAELLQEGFVGAQEGGGVGAAGVPHQYNPAVGAQDAGEFLLGGGAIEPMEGLGGDNVMIRRDCYQFPS